MTFIDFIERAHARNDRYRVAMAKLAQGRPAFIPPPLKDTHIFHLGEDENVLEAIRPIREELAADCAEGVPMPFSDVACVSTVTESSRTVWILDRVLYDPAGTEAPPSVEAVLKEQGLTAKQRLVIVRQSELDVDIGEIPLMTIWHVWFCGTTDSEYQILSTLDPACNALFGVGARAEAQALVDGLIKETVPIIEQLAAVSHPQNYIVKVTPRLTPKEERRVADGRERPVRKAPHFIVVDHDVLVGMSSRKASEGTHASPVPHHRRGHWMRLAERCRHAKLLGKDRVYVRPTYVGERLFADEKNLYEVLMDFEKPKEMAGSAASIR